MSGRRDSSGESSRSGEKTPDWQPARWTGGGPAAPAAPHWALLLAGTLGIWLGIHALRSFLAMVVWNTGEDLPSTQMGLIALSVHAVGLLAWLATRLAGGSRPAWRFGLWLAVLAVARQAVPQEVVTPSLAFATWVVWLWWLPNWLRELAGRRLMQWAAPMVVAGVAAQAAGQIALQGLDLPMRADLWSVLGAAFLAVAFIGCLHRSVFAPRPVFASSGESASLRTARDRGGPTEATAAGRAQYGAAAWGGLALGPYLFLQMTLLANPGRIEMSTHWVLGAGWDLFQAGVIILVGLVAGLLALLVSPNRWFRLVWCVAAVAVLAVADGLPDAAFWTLIPQIGLSVALGAAFAPVENSGGRPFGGTAAGAMVLFALTFLYYSRYGWPLLWPVAAVLVILPALRPAGRVSAPGLAAPGLAAVLAFAGLAATLVPFPGAAPAPTTAVAPAQLKVLNYNIHQGFDTYSVPSMQAAGDFIASVNADLVALQEVGRGWTINGAPDLVSYLRWRFPGYRVVYGPMNGDLWGNVILSRYPVAETGFQRFPPGKSDFTRGYVWARVPTVSGDLWFASAHLSASEGYDEDRAAQATELATVFGNKGRVVVAGDFNAHPDDLPIQTVLAAGLKDVSAAHGLGTAFTYSAANPYERIDYIFASPDVTPVSAEIPRPLTSDHLPVVAVLRMP